MTIASQVWRHDYTSTGGTEYPYTFKILDEAHIAVYANAVLQTLNSHYTVSGVGDAVGGTVTFTAAPTAGHAVILTRTVPLTQLTDFVQNDAGLSETKEDAADKLTMIAQQQQEAIDRSAKFAATSAFSLPTLPDPEVGKYLRWVSSSTSALQNAAQQAIDGSVEIPVIGAKGGTGQDTSAIIGMPILRAGTWYFPAAWYDPTTEGFSESATAADNTTAMQTTITNAVAANVAVRMPCGTFNIAAATRLGATATYYAWPPVSGLTMTGAGMGRTILKMADDQTATHTRNPHFFYGQNLALDNIHFADFSVDFNAANNDLDAATTTSNSFFHAYGDTTDGDDMCVTNLTFDRVEFTNHPGANIILVNNRKVGTYTYSSDIAVRACRFYRVGLDTADHSCINLFADNVKIIANHFENLSTDTGPLYVACPFESHGSNAVFALNTVRHFYKGVMVSQNFMEDALGAHVIGNTLLDIVYVGVELSCAVTATAGGKAAHNTVVNGNTIVFSEETTHTNTPYRIGVNVITGVPCRGLTVTANHIARRALTSDTIRVLGVYQALGTDNRATGYVDAVKIDGNTFYGMSLALFLNATSSVWSWLRDVEFIDNTVENCYDIGGAVGYGVYAIGDSTHAPKLRCTGNTIRDTQAVSTTGHGFNIGDYVDRLTIKGNEYDNVTTPLTIGAAVIGHATAVDIDEGWGGTSAAISTGATIAHGMPVAPNVFTVTPAEAGPTDVVAVADATNLTVGFGGGGSKTFSWSARYKK